MSLATKNFILNDETYFTLTKHQMSGNYAFDTISLVTSHPEVKFKYQRKFQPKLMLYVRVPNAGVSQPYFKPSGLAISHKVYQHECLSKILISFIEKYHSNSNYDL